MWVPVHRTAEDMFVDMGDSDPVGQTAQAVQVNFNPFLDVNMLMTKKSILTLPDCLTTTTDLTHCPLALTW